MGRHSERTRPDQTTSQPVLIHARGCSRLPRICCRSRQNLCFSSDRAPSRCRRFVWLAAVAETMTMPTLMCHDSVLSHPCLAAASAAILESPDAHSRLLRSPQARRTTVFILCTSEVLARASPLRVFRDLRHPPAHDLPQQLTDLRYAYTASSKNGATIPTSSTTSTTTPRPSFCSRIPSVALQHTDHQAPFLPPQPAPAHSTTASGPSSATGRHSPRSCCAWRTLTLHVPVVRDCVFRRQYPAAHRRRKRAEEWTQSPEEKQEPWRVPLAPRAARPRPGWNSGQCSRQLQCP